MALSCDDPTGDMPRIGSMKALREAEAACTRCPIYKHATQFPAKAGASEDDDR